MGGWRGCRSPYLPSIPPEHFRALVTHTHTHTHTQMYITLEFANGLNALSSLSSINLYRCIAAWELENYHAVESNGGEAYRRGKRVEKMLERMRNK